jgi:hypothetical protein
VTVHPRGRERGASRCRRRRDRVSRAGLLGLGAAAGASVGALARPGAARAAVSANDRDILNYALALEHLQAAFYTEAERRGALRGRAAQAARVVGAVERAHVDAFRKLLWRSAVKRPVYDFRGTTDDQQSFLKTAVALEDLAVPAYKNEASKIESDAVLAASVAIHSVEARHAAWMRHLFGIGRSRARSTTPGRGVRSPACRVHPLHRRAAANGDAEAATVHRLTGRRLAAGVCVGAAVAAAGIVLLDRSETQLRRRAGAVAVVDVLPTAPRPALVVRRPAPLGSTRHLSYWSAVRRAVSARAGPSAAARPVARLDTRTPEGTATVVLVVARRKDAAGRLWLRLRLAVLPAGTTGWVPRSALGGYGATLLRDGRTIFRVPVGIGRDTWPTPAAASTSGTGSRVTQARSTARSRSARALRRPHRLARRRVRRNPRHRPSRPPSRSRLARVYPHAQRGYPPAWRPDGCRYAPDDPVSAVLRIALVLLAAGALGVGAAGAAEREPVGCTNTISLQIRGSTNRECVDATSSADSTASWERHPIPTQTRKFLDRQGRVIRRSTSQFFGVIRVGRQHPVPPANRDDPAL